MARLLPYIASGALLLAAWGVERWLRSRRLSGWPVVQGIIETQRVRDIGSGKMAALSGMGPAKVLEAELGYSYQVMGEFYSGFHAVRIDSETDADPIFAAYPHGTPAFVHYDPRHPEQSVMEFDKQRVTLFTLK